jgi:translation initiation factor IF-1
MAAETIRLVYGAIVTGRIIEHLGGGMVTVECEGKRYTGRKVSTERRGG